MSCKAMLFFFNEALCSKMFFALSVLFHFVIKNTNCVYCADFPAVDGNLKRTLNNATIPFKDEPRSDRLQNNEPIEMKFFIKQNTIICTGESRELGAKYLNETRLSSNYECLTWCLETPTCNTAVYEEKNMQSCYMFDCGSAEKPLCKFTDHNFFTSSVIKMTQHSYELSQWGQQVKKERDGKEDKQVTPAVLVTSTPTTSPVSVINKEKPEKKESLCHHYQFQCINSSECIAIYNVCDGIPQCPDASDESPELKCPTKDVPKKSPNMKGTSLKIQHTLVNKAPIQKQEQLPVRPSIPYIAPQNVEAYNKPPERKEMVYKNHKWPSSYSGSSIAKTAPQYRHRVEDSDALGSPFVHKHSQFISANDPHVEKLNRWANDYDQYSPHSTSLEQQYNPYERIDEQYLPNQMSADYDTGKNFAGYHQDDIPYWPGQDILQDNSYTVDEFPQRGVQNLNKVMGYPDKESAYSQQITRTAEQYPEAKLSMHNKPLMNPGQASDGDDYKLQRYSHSRQQQPYISLEDSVPQHYSNYPEIKMKGFNSLQNMDDAMYNNDDLIRASIVNQLPKKIDQIHRQHEHDLKHLNKNAVHPTLKEKHGEESTKLPKDDSLIVVKPTSHSKSIQKTVLDFKMSVAELYQSSSTHTHEANSAIVALVLGMTVSFFLIVLLVCRMKTLRRRLSRKGRSLAHDADYLVNGMYL